MTDQEKLKAITELHKLTDEGWCVECDEVWSHGTQNETDWICKTMQIVREIKIEQVYS
jgi:hypothetical protein